MLARRALRLVVCGRLLDPTVGMRGEEACLALGDGIVEEVREEPPAGRPLLDLRGLDNVYILPGLIDIHVHLRGLSLSYKEDEESGTAAAARGGITLVADMPNTVPRLDTIEALSEKLRRLSTYSRVEYRVYAAVPPRPEDVDKLASMPSVAGFKIYPSDIATRWRSIKRLLGLQDMLIVLHPELPEAERTEHENLSVRGAVRGCHWEQAAAELLASHLDGARLHVTHASCASTIHVAKKIGASVDVTPHHLFYTAPPRGGCLWKVNPPLREPPEQALLLKHLIEGRIDAVASDHAPHTAEEKRMDPLLCPPGIAWLEAWPHILSCLVSANALSIEEYLRLTSLGPAEILGTRRCLGPGCPASITVMKFNVGRRFAGNKYSKARHTPYFMERLCSETVATIAAGRVAYLAPGWRIM